MHIVREVNVPGNVRHVSTSLVRNVSTKTNQSFVWEFYWDILNNVTVDEPSENSSDSFNGSSRVVVEKRWVNGDSGNVSSVDVGVVGFGR